MNMKVKIYQMSRLIIFQIVLYSTVSILNLIYTAVNYDTSIACIVFVSGMFMLNLGIALCKYSLS
jgi:hypothetical protein